MTTFSLCMIVKNESAILKRCLDSIADIMDEIIIVDTGSTDNTKEIAREFTDKIYDYTWINDFADARNFAFSKATMDYIYSADADEVLDTLNHQRLLQLKEAMLPEIEIVQMHYITPPEHNTTSNFIKEYRPKLYKRLRTFTWIDAVHETVRLDPIIYDSDIEIQHLPMNLHSSRDFAIFHSVFEKEGKLSAKLHAMYAKELFISGTAEDFKQAEEIFMSTLFHPESTEDMHKEAICVLCHLKRITGAIDEFFSLAFKLMPDAICAELCYEIGCHFMDKEDFMEAIQWFETAIDRSQSIIDIRRNGKLPLEALSKCHRLIAEKIREENPEDEYFYESYMETAQAYAHKAMQWEIPICGDK